MVEILDEMNNLYSLIYSYRSDIASYKKNKIEKRADAWKDATGTAKEKEDYVRSVVANIDEAIDFCEAEIEKAYNSIRVLELKLEYTNE